MVLEDKIEYRSFHFFGDEILPLQLSTYLLTIIWVNLRVSLESFSWTGNRRKQSKLNSWEQDRYIHASVLLSIMVSLACVIVTQWSVLPPTLLPFLLLATISFVVVDYLIFKVVPHLFKLFISKKEASNAINNKLHEE